MNTPLIKWAMFFMLIVLVEHFVFKHVAYDAVKNLDMKQVISALSFSVKKAEVSQMTFEGETVVPLTRKNGAWLIDVELNELYEARLIVDTGASITTLSEDLAFDMGLSPDPRYAPGTFQTANGNTQAWITHVRTIRTEDAETDNVRVAIIDFTNFSSQGISGLLGLNFLDKFDWRLDQESQVLILKSQS